VTSCAGVVRRGDAEPPRGLAIKSSAMYIARRWSPEIEVYRIGSQATINARKTYSFAGSWRCDDLVASFTDDVVHLLGWVASNRQVVLTVSSSSGKVVASWPVIKMPRRLSVDDESNSVLVACQDALRSYSTSGLLQSVTPLKMNAGSVWHAMPISAQASFSRVNRLIDYCVFANCSSPHIVFSFN